ncbi:hypothetical protein PAXINDRAFT_18445 [Paxillus involutus ATCC 200175]|uniref:Uncharacterized protein n=1 Tax=Paxillus involutus ATCC 200175 TaxID=664439 RepID=A0A0C9TM65_PAXIN|nr:hypothetical protein PAXINDRAFT_18445 [Paxillus involutus ATCC 200175]
MEFIQDDFATSPSPSYTQCSPPASPAQPQSTPGMSFREPVAPHPVDPPGEQLRVLPPLQYQPVIATRTVPVPMHGGHMVPLAQSRPALIPIRLTPLSIPQPAELRAPRQRKRAAGRRKDILEAKTPASETQPSLGLYDDPEALDELHQDPLVHTVPTSQSDDNSESDNSSDTSSLIPHDTPRNRPFLPEVPSTMAHEPEELHIGMTMSLDWFGRKTSVYGPSRSSGVLLLCISNLPWALRYRAENLLIPFMTPGPTEPTGPQLQNYLKVVVDDLLELYTHGVRYHTPLYLQGRLVRVVLLGVVCDHPAMYQDEIFSDASLRNEFPGRKGEDHRKRCYEEKDLPEAQRAMFFKEHGARWTELARLLYFDLVRQTIIDPMHNLLLGIVKTQWYSQWIQTPALRASTDKRARELDVIHRFLASFETPLWAGKLPTHVGEPAGGSLTADEYKFSACSAWPIIIPVVWVRFIDEAEHDFATTNTRQHKALAKYLKDHETWKKNSEMSVSASTQKKGRKKTEGAEPVPPKLPKLCMQREEPINLLRLSAALQILCGSSIKLDMLPRAQQLLQEYLLEFKRICRINLISINRSDRALF